MLVLDKVIDYRHAIHPAESGLFESSFLAFVIDHGPVVDPDGTRVDFARDPE
jgi:hypothetical protein